MKSILAVAVLTIAAIPIAFGKPMTAAKKAVVLNRN
jgi:hypothetical protein